MILIEIGDLARAVCITSHLNGKVETILTWLFGYLIAPIWKNMSWLRVPPENKHDDTQNRRDCQAYP